MKVESNVQNLEFRGQLGAVPLSDDVLTKANIGLWAFEMDEGKAPRMYVNEPMLKLIGLKEQLSPEETYHAWYDFVDKDSYPLVHEAVDKMTNYEHAEVQYPWHHPDGYTMIVRCGGVRNPEYKEGIRIEGTHQDVTSIVSFNDMEMAHARRTEIELVKSRFRADALAYVADNSPDLDKFMNFFGKRILEITDCDQVIFRDIDGYRIAINAPGIVDVEQQVCSDCPFSEIQGSLYKKGGIVLMDDCSKGFDSTMVHPDCPAKSSFMQHVYSEGKLSGLLTIHYLKGKHRFSEDDIDIMKSVAAYLGLLLARINAKNTEREKYVAEAANKSKTEFLFNMSHDIRTPMNAILGYTDIALRHSNDEERTKESLAKIKLAGGHLLNLINDILEMSRIEAGRMELNEIAVDMRKAIKSVEQMSEPLATQKSIIFTIDDEDIKNPYVYADELHINEIFINLISNAIKYTPEGGKVKYTAYQNGEIKDGKVTYYFEVADNGMGMSEDFQKHLFEAFSREQSAKVSRTEGTGLGLSIVKRIVDMADGKIDVKSKLNEGSVFTVELPMRVLEDDEIEEFKKIEQTINAIPSDVHFKGKKILLTEDNDMNREIATDILTEAGFIVEQAEDGEIALEMVRKKGIDYYDFILMDIQMPVMNGYEAAQAIRKLPKGDSIPIIALSANAFAEDMKASLDAGMNAHIAKPIKTKELFEALAKFIG